MTENDFFSNFKHKYKHEHLLDFDDAVIHTCPVNHKPFCHACRNDWRVHRCLGTLFWALCSLCGLAGLYWTYWCKWFIKQTCKAFASVNQKDIQSWQRRNPKNNRLKHFCQHAWSWERGNSYGHKSNASSWR